MIITYPDKSLFKLQLLKAGALALAVFVVSMITPWGALGLLPVLYTLARRAGVQIDSEKKLYRKYKQLIGKKGDWRELSPFTAIVIREVKGHRRLHHVYSSTTKEMEGKCFDIYLMDKSHRKRLFVDSFAKKDKATLSAEELGRLTKLPVSEYSPSAVERQGRRR